MNKLLSITRGVAARISLAAMASALLMVALPAGAGIANTKHNLGSTNNRAGTPNMSSSTDEICVFCHTPHAAETGTDRPPLWNKALGTVSTGFTTYSTTNSATIDGSVAAVGSISLACLSCHDGTQAMDNIINAPGSGGYDATGGGANGLGWAWTGGNVTTAGMLTGVANLGKDLTNDHPIGIQYCGGGPNSTTPTGACKDKDFFAAQTASINSSQVWWVDTSVGTAAARDKTDMILYTRTFPDTTTGPSVECGSCHDPHVEQGVGSAGQTFLRIANTGSAVCLACHNK